MPCSFCKQSHTQAVIVEKEGTNMRLVTFPSVEQFRNAVKEVVLRATYIGRAEDGTPLYDDSLPGPGSRTAATMTKHG